MSAFSAALRKFSCRFSSLGQQCDRFDAEDLESLCASPQRVLPAESELPVQAAARDRQQVIEQAATFELPAEQYCVQGMGEALRQIGVPVEIAELDKVNTKYTKAVVLHGVATIMSHWSRRAWASASDPDGSEKRKTQVEARGTPKTCQKLAFQDTPLHKTSATHRN